MARARIFKPAKNAMQSGARAPKWVLAYEPETRRAPDPLMGWTSADDTLNEVRLHFERMEEAVDFATKNGTVFLAARGQTGATSSRPSLVTLETLLLGVQPIKIYKSFGGRP